MILIRPRVERSPCSILSWNGGRAREKPRPRANAGTGLSAIKFGQASELAGLLRNFLFYISWSPCRKTCCRTLLDCGASCKGASSFRSCVGQTAGRSAAATCNVMQTNDLTDLGPKNTSVALAKTPRKFQRFGCSARLLCPAEIERPAGSHGRCVR
jgi:hypothetical protein